MKAQHTKGPWICCPSPTSDGSYNVFRPDGDYLTLDDEIHQANAILIGCAPRLLSALELAAQYLEKAIADGLLEDCQAPLSGKPINVIRDAISQANGETP